jgi:hypothetical protein
VGQFKKWHALYCLSRSPCFRDCVKTAALAVICHPLQVVDSDHFSASGFKPKYIKKLPFGFSLRLKPIGSLPFFILAKAALQIFNIHDLKSPCQNYVAGGLFGSTSIFGAGCLNCHDLFSGRGWRSIVGIGLQAQL